ncbi:hypothetical protein F0521_35310 [Ferrimonas sp. YFM]|nr:hypothetical protein F0521_35310 [Ferrimonas sp. YFM]
MMNRDKLLQATKPGQMIHLDIGEDDHLIGELMSVQSDYLTIHQATDFHFDGLAHVRLESIHHLIDDEQSRFYSELFEKTNHAPRSDELQSFPETFDRLLARIISNRLIVSYHIEDMMLLGETLGYLDEMITIRPINTLGKVGEAETISKNELTCIEEGTEYVLAYARHHLNS